MGFHEVLFAKKVVEPKFMLRIVAITGGKNVPSRHFRIKSVIQFFRQRDIDLVELCPRINCYPPQSRLLRLPWFALAIIERLVFAFRSRGYDAVILHRNGRTAERIGRH
jgi:hypothetical protein